VQKISKGKEMGNNVEYLINKFKKYLQDITIGLETNSQNRKFNVVLRNDNITAITNNNKELNIERDTRNALKENNFTSKGGLSYAPVVAKYIKDNFLDNEESIKIKNIILYGSPGVGKTYNIKKLISLIESRENEKNIFKEIENNSLNNGIEADQIVNNISDRVKFITFHQSFGYEDFIEGFRPNEDGEIKLQDGIFKTICDDANNDKEKNYYLVIDEINRGNISKIFGELITLIEEDKRDTLEVTLPYSKKTFKIPSNLYIIGTMNSTDKSIALIDIALRRRFTFLKMKPKADLIDYERAIEIFENLNKQIEEDLGEDYQLGHSYFMTIQDDSDLDFILEYKIIPLLEEYYYGDDRLTKIIQLCKPNSIMDSDEQ
jgi:5-methylcytosine-specific restriction protein B